MSFVSLYDSQDSRHKSDKLQSAENTLEKSGVILTHRSLNASDCELLEEEKHEEEAWMRIIFFSLNFPVLDLNSTVFILLNNFTLLV